MRCTFDKWSFEWYFASSELFLRESVLGMMICVYVCMLIWWHPVINRGQNELNVNEYVCLRIINTLKRSRGAHALSRLPYSTRISIESVRACVMMCETVTTK